MRHATFAALVVLAAATIWCSLSLAHPVARGLDLQGGARVTQEPDPSRMESGTSVTTPVATGLDPQGGMRVILEPDPSKMKSGTSVTTEDMERVRDILESRVNSFGLSGAKVRMNTVGNQQQILMTLPDVANPKEALDQLTTVAHLEFRHLRDVQTSRKPGGRYKINVIPGNPERGKPESYTFIDTETNKPVDQAVVLKDAPIIVKGSDLLPTSSPDINPTNAQPYITFELNATGTRVFGDFTSENVGAVLAVTLDGKIICAPSINEPITGGKGQISLGLATMAEARVLANLLNSGALPVPLRPAAFH